MASQSSVSFPAGPGLDLHVYMLQVATECAGRLKSDYVFGNELRGSPFNPKNMEPFQTHYLVRVLDLHVKPIEGVVFSEYSLAASFARTVQATGRAVELRKSEVLK